MLYRLILKTRHNLYNKGVRKSYSAEVPTICVGNITVGGTGKTPHVEMILRLLEESPEWKGKHIAVLSRGYRRRARVSGKSPPMEVRSYSAMSRSR